MAAAVALPVPVVVVTGNDPDACCWRYLITVPVGPAMLEELDGTCAPWSGLMLLGSDGGCCRDCCWWGCCRGGCWC